VGLDAVSQAVEKALPVAVVAKDIPPIVPANGNVIDSTFIFNAERSGHNDKLQNYNLSVNTKGQN
jgi:hypothetical protein